MQLCKNNVGNLDEQPAENQVSDACLEDAATLQVFEQANVLDAGAVLRADHDAALVFAWQLRRNG